MNINNVYECVVLRIIERKCDIQNDKLYFKFGYLKKTLVYEYDSLNWIDLSTGTKYLNDTSLVFGLEGNLYVPSSSIKPISAIVDFKRIHMTKNGIVKEYNKQRGKRLVKNMQK